MQTVARSAAPFRIPHRRAACIQVSGARGVLPRVAELRKHVERPRL